MKNKVWLVFSKEMKMMWRDRRLTVSVAVISLIVMPFLMGFIGNIDRLTGGREERVAVVLHTDEPAVREALAQLPELEVLEDEASSGTLDRPYLRVVRQGRTIWIYGDGTEGRVREAARELQAHLEALREREVVRALTRLGIDPAVLSPYDVAFVDTAGPDRRSGMILSVLIPYLAIILLVSNANRALYVAVGEKEKNTLASLLVTNTPRHAIVIGKILAIMLFAVVSSLLLVVGMILFANFGFSLGGLPEDGGYALSAAQSAQLVVNLTALALFIAAIIMMLGTYARSAREAGVYTTPLLFIAIFLAVFSFSSTRFGPMAYAVPILGNALAMRDSFLGQGTAGLLLLVVASNLLFFTLLVFVSVLMYGRERILFRE